MLAQTETHAFDRRLHEGRVFDGGVLWYLHERKLRRQTSDGVDSWQPPSVRRKRCVPVKDGKCVQWCVFAPRSSER